MGTTLSRRCPSRCRETIDDGARRHTAHHHAPLILLVRKLKIVADVTTAIVAARPDHASFTAWVVLTAFRSHLARGFWDFFVDGDEQQCLRYLEALATTAAPHWAHHSTFLVAEVDGRPASALCGYFDEELGIPALQKGLAEANERLARKPEEIQAGLRRTASVFHVMPRHDPGTWIIENVATHPDHRRHGLVHDLLSAALERGRQRGATRAGIGVMIGNDRAQRAYERAGFHVFEEKRHADFEAVWGCPGIRAMSRPL
jgi:ribosomal protein S18 acetylase RimI-like enzyme